MPETSYYAESELRGLGLKDYGERVYLSRKASLYGAANISLGSDARIDDFCVISAGEGGVVRSPGLRWHLSGAGLPVFRPRPGNSERS